MTDYVLYRVKYRQGNHPPEQTVVEVKDTGKALANRDAAEALGREWLLELSANGREYRFISTEPFVAKSERPTEPLPAPPARSVIEQAARKAQPIPAA